MFRCINGSVAVSAYELEALPLPSPRSMKEIERLVKRRAKRETLGHPRDRGQDSVRHAVYRCNGRAECWLRPNQVTRMTDAQADPRRDVAGRSGAYEIGERT